MCVYVRALGVWFEVGMRDRWCLYMSMLDAGFEMHERIQWTKECQCKPMHTHIQNSCHSCEEASEWVNERKSRKGDAIQVQNMEKEAAAAIQEEKRMKTSALVFDQRQNIRKKHTNTHFFRLLSQSMHAQFYSLSRSSRVAWVKKCSECVLVNCDMRVHVHDYILC